MGRVILTQDDRGEVSWLLPCDSCQAVSLGLFLPFWQRDLGGRSCSGRALPLICLLAVPPGVPRVYVPEAKRHQHQHHQLHQQ